MVVHCPFPHPDTLRMLHFPQDIAPRVRCGISLLHPPSRELAVAMGIRWRGRGWRMAPSMGSPMRCDSVPHPQTTVCCAGIVGLFMVYMSAQSRSLSMQKTWRKKARSYDPRDYTFARTKGKANM